jgi:hypothetical protein
MVLRIPVRWAQVDISKPELDNIDFSILQKTEFLAERCCKA